ncbi:hypothetical protein [Streptomyces rubellomurinus]|uniref:Uncharacterized protein n=2 Tax=Streptomyces TaxID=1883 RepID=A0A0F2TG38_STRR3|nr:hypothetical protein [Streptomyces rubellomurinus]KJS55810.1 hypothetical protein VM98_11175 [Streptomyces rubellomurinus subsp. indigoferus]KJS61215.1 hypothetical protein VM95_16780 [Streptomyces rubellomurinus]
MAEGGRRRRQWLAAVVAVVVLAGAGWWWRSAHAPAELPAGACWSVLTRADLKPLAEDEQGTFAASYWLDDDGKRLRPSPTRYEQSCEVRRSPADAIVRVAVRSVNESAMTALYGPGSQATYSRLDFGADVQGWVGQDKVGLGFRCDNPESMRMEAPYVGVEVSTRFTHPVPDGKHRAILDILLKVTKAVVADFPCANPVRLPDGVPASATNFPPPGP